MAFPDDSLLHVFEKVPVALQACIQALASEHTVSHRIIPGSGIHVLRSVSKGARNLADGTVRSFTLHLDDRTGTALESSFLQKQISFLQLTKLSELKIFLSGKHLHSVPTRAGSQLCPMKCLYNTTHCD